jgi:hypothetical protein
MASTVYGMRCDSNLNLGLEQLCDEADIILPTRNEKRTITIHNVTEFPHFTGLDHEVMSDRLGDTAYLYVSDLDYLPRLVAALKRGIELCGGKPSSY